MNEPLVSVVIITYRSALFVTETLDSIYAQTYKNIELVVSDDCSADNTVAVVKDWIEAHRHRFTNCILRAGEQNLGITGNVNAGVKCATGHYVKLLAGDDLLLPDAVDTYVQGCRQMESPYVFGWLKKFSDGKDGRKIWDEAPPVDFFALDAAGQYAVLLRENRVYGPLFFCERAFLEQMGYYNPRYTMLEDYPMWLKMTAQGYKLHFIPQETVLYRMSPESVSHGGGGRVVNERYFQCYWQFYREQCRPVLRKSGRIWDLLINTRRWFYPWLILKLGNDRKSRSVRIAEYFYLRKYLPGRR